MSALTNGMIAIALSLMIFVVLDCGGSAPGPCPLEVPEDNSFCNSGGVVVYCHYDCVSGRGADYYALCSGPRWTVTKYDVACALDGGEQ